MTILCIQVASHLLAWGWKFIPLNVKNLEGNTAWDILQEQTEVGNRELRDMLHCARALSGSSLPTVTSYAHYLRQPKSICRETFRTDFARVLKNISDEKRNALLVIGALLVTVTYQAVLSPPGGLWPDDQSSDIAPHKAGTAIGMRGWPFQLFLIFNSVTFVFSNAIILLLAPFSGY